MMRRVLITVWESGGKHESTKTGNRDRQETLGSCKGVEGSDNMDRNGSAHLRVLKKACFLYAEAFMRRRGSGSMQQRKRSLKSCESERADRMTSAHAWASRASSSFSGVRWTSPPSSRRNVSSACLFLLLYAARRTWSGNVLPVTNSIVLSRIFNGNVALYNLSPLLNSYSKQPTDHTSMGWDQPAWRSHSGARYSCTASQGAATHAKSTRITGVPTIGGCH
eukprot:763153-Hanusia_phi.AAC.10